MSIGLDLDEAFQNTSHATRVGHDLGMQIGTSVNDTSPFPNFGKNVLLTPPQNEIEDDSPPMVAESHGEEIPGRHISPVTLLPDPTIEPAPSAVPVKTPMVHAEPDNSTMMRRIRDTSAPVRERFAQQDEEPIHVQSHGSNYNNKPKKNGNDFLKSILFSMMILLAISAHAFVAFIFENYVTSAGIYTIKQEVGMRLLYPVAILVIIWLVKNYR